MKIIKFAVCIGIAVALIMAGRWYNGQLDKQAVEQAQKEQQQAQQAEQKLMESLIKEDVVVGTGVEAKAGDTVTVNYEGTLDNGMVFDSSYARKQPFTFHLGTGEVIKGWDLGVQGMKVGGKRKLTIPSELAYGTTGIASIPPNATLHFTVELLNVQGGT